MQSISILLPTRGRPRLLKRLFDSIISTTSGLSGVEVVLYMDEDDPESHLVSAEGIRLVRLIRPPGSAMGAIYNECYKVCSGSYLFLMNDDAVFRTHGWDDMVTDAFRKFPDGVALVYGNDLDQGERVPTFPILSRTYCEILGGIAPHGYRSLHIESHIFDIFRRVEGMGHSRIVYLPDMVFEHMHYAVGKSSLDDTYRKKGTTEDSLLFLELDEERSWQARRLAQFIGGGKDIPR